MKKTQIASRGKLAKNWPPASVLNPFPGFMWSNLLALDLHNTLVDFSGPFGRYVKAIMNKDVYPERSLYYDWAYDPEFGLSPDEFMAALENFSQLARNSGYGGLSAYQGTLRFLEQVKAEGIRPVIYTWTPGVGDPRLGRSGRYSTGIAQERTRQLVRELGFPIDPETDIKFMQPGDKRKAILEYHIPLIVEDSPVTAVQIASMAHAAILVPHSYNRIRFPNVLRLDNLAQLTPTVIEFYGRLREAGVLLEIER